MPQKATTNKQTTQNAQTYKDRLNVFMRQTTHWYNYML